MLFLTFSALIHEKLRSIENFNAHQAALGQYKPLFSPAGNFYDVFLKFPQKIL
jgi:hypothetical protein